MLFRPIRGPHLSGDTALLGPARAADQDLLSEWADSPRLGAVLLRAVSQRPWAGFFRGLIAVYIYMLVLLPSGSVFGVNVKVACFLLLLPVAAQVSFARGQITVSRLVKLLAVPAILLLWAFLSPFYGFDTFFALSQYKDLMITCCTCWFAAVLCAEGPAETLFLLRTVLYAEVSASVIKVLLLGYAFARGIPVSDLVELIHTVFGVQLMTFDFETALGRLQFISDNLIPICIFAILCYRRLLGVSAGRALLMIFVLAVSDLFTFSRYLWGFAVAAFLLGMIVGKKDRFQLALVAILAAVTLISLPFLLALSALRFSTTVVSSSDADRVTQVAALRVFFADAPWFGHGLGSYTHRVVRGMDLPYVYEAQVLALCGQIGMIGVLFLAVLLVSYFRGLWSRERDSGGRSVGLFLLMLVWLGGGFLNPWLVASAASVSYIAMFAMTGIREEPEWLVS